MATLDLQVGAGAGVSTDDAWQQLGGGMNNSYNRLFFGRYSVGLHHGLRFVEGVTGLQNATINSGTKLNFPYAAASDSGVFFATWYAELAAAPPTFSLVASNISDTAQRPRTTASTPGGGAEFGIWSSGSAHDFPTSPSTAIAALIQELADNYDPSAIVLLHIYASGSGERIARAYEWNSIYGAKLHIDFTAAGAVQTLAATAIAATFTLPAATLAPSTAATLVATAIATALFVPTAALTGESVATLAASPASATFTLPAATLAPAGVATLVATAASPAFAVPTASLVIVGAQILTAPEISATFAVPTQTLVGVGTVALTAPVAVATFVVPAYVLAPDKATLVATAIAATFVVGDAALIPRKATLTATAIGLTFVIPEATLSGGAVLLGFEPWGDITQLIDPDECAPGTVFLLQANIFTGAAVNAVTARLFDLTAGAEVVGSYATSTSTTVGVKRSATFNLLPGLREYRLEFGGPSGALVYCHGGEAKGVSS